MKVDIRYLKSGVIHREVDFNPLEDPKATKEWAEDQLLEADDTELLEGLMDFDQSSNPGSYFDADSLSAETVEIAEKDYASSFETDLWKEYLGKDDELRDKCKRFAMGFYFAGTECDYGTWKDLFDSRDLREDGFIPTEEFENYHDDDIKNSVAKLYSSAYETFKRLK